MAGMNLTYIHFRNEATHQEGNLHEVVKPVGRGKNGEERLNHSETSINNPVDKPIFIFLVVLPTTSCHQSYYQWQEPSWRNRQGKRIQ